MTTNDNDDAILHLKHAREAATLAEADEANHILGELELAPGEAAAEVIEYLDELTGFAEDETIAGAAASLLERARKAGETTSAGIADVLELLGDLEINPKASADDDFEELDELDAAVEDALAHESVQSKVVSIPKADFARPDPAADETRRKKIELSEQMREAFIRLGGTITDDDPLASEKRRVANTLKKVGRTLGDLPTDYWALRRTAPYGERSRQNELNRVMEEGRAEMRAAERVRELIKLGRPLNYDLLPRTDQKKIDGNIRQRRHRSKLPKSSKKTIVPLPFADVRPELLSDKLIKMRRSLDTWAVVRTTARARQLRKPDHQEIIVKAAKIYAWHFCSSGTVPSQGDLAKGLGCNEDKAGRKLRLLKALCQPDGPWHMA